MMKAKGRYTPWVGSNIFISKEELEKSARTLIGKPVKANFKEIVGIIIDAEYRDGGIDYEMELNDPRTEYMYRERLEDNIFEVVFTGLSLNEDKSLSETKIGEDK
ncbi:MAG TPA: hypothetical protein VMW50_03070 [Dehalococcoidia bacterium]|nr:hypothetical protein [Dehalococcoidia bacterium]